jgi:uncharacterized protein (TIGR02600 family)
MPVVEPYAISEPFSTAGKVNMNYQIVPFTYITRNTALRSVLASEQVTANLPTSAYTLYKNIGGPTARIPQVRYALNLDDKNGTLRQFKEKFAGGDIFRSASEICDIFLVPTSVSGGWTTDAAARTAWYDKAGNFALVGDNSRERPYGNIYPRLTTKSNVFSVHFTVQTLKNASGSPTQWDETKGKVLGEYRGTTTLERYIDPNNPLIPDYPDRLSQITLNNLDNFYKWRVISSSQFAP